MQSLFCTWANLEDEHGKRISLLPSRPREEDRDWSVADSMKETLGLQNYVIEILLNAADAVANTGRETTVAEVKCRLDALQKRSRAVIELAMKNLDLPDNITKRVTAAFLKEGLNP